MAAEEVVLQGQPSTPPQSQPAVGEAGEEAVEAVVVRGAIQPFRHHLQLPQVVGVGVEEEGVGG